MNRICSVSRTSDIIMAVLFAIMFFHPFKMNSSEKVTSDSLAQRLTYQVWAFPQEKIHVVTDREAYIAGDTIWFRAFLANASTHAKPRNGSKYIYIELTSPFGETLKRLKIKEQDGKFAGFIPLDEETAEGNYTLSAYTQFMINASSDYFHHRSIPILSNLSQKYILSVEFEDRQMTATLTDRHSRRPVRAERIGFYGPDDAIYQEGIRHRSSHTLPVTVKIQDAGIVKVKFDSYEKFVALPQDTRAIFLSFHPEGGYLIPEQENILAFKAIDSKGRSVDFSGRIVDEDSKTAAVITSIHRGMGSIRFTPRRGKSYRAIVDGEIYPLPDAVEEASVLNITSPDTEKISVKITGKVPADASLLAHNCGNVTFAIPVKHNEMTLERNPLGSGIVQLLLADSAGNILSSRMIFNHTGYLTGTIGDTIPEGDYSIRAYRGAADNTSASIVADFMIQSELKGYVEDPDYYFTDRDAKKDSDLDLLMLTQGWERYDIPGALQKKFKYPESPIEIGGEISGKVKSRWRGKPLENALVMLISPKLDFASQTLTDTDGRFSFTGLDWPENTPFVVQVYGEKGDREHNFEIDEDVFPYVNLIGYNNEDKQPDIDYSIYGAGTILLEELEVTAPLTLEESRREMKTALGIRTYTAEDLDRMNATTYEEVLRKIPGIRIVNGQVLSTRPRGIYNTGLGGAPVEFWVDGTQWTSAESGSSGSLSLAHATAPSLIGGSMLPEHTLKSHGNTLTEFSGIYPFHTIESIEYYMPSASAIISSTAANGGGALVITTREGRNAREWDDNLFLKTVRPLGYQRPSDSYSPHYHYDPTSAESTYNAAWLPVATGEEVFTLLEDCNVDVEGIANGYIPVSLHKEAMKESTK